MNKTANIPPHILKNIYFKVNEYFNNIKKCDIHNDEKHNINECCYIGDPYERLKKFNEIKKEIFEQYEIFE
jgi:hypothetical protein